MRFKLSICILELLFSWVVIGHAQVTTGTISGAVTDSTGAVLPAAKVVVQNEDTGIARTVQADASGRYSAPSLGLGNYQVTASMEGFQTEVRKGILLTVGREAVVDLRLNVGAVTQTVEVIGEAPLVQTTESTVSYLVNASTIRDLPLNGRDVTQLILLQPGIAQAVNSSASSASNGFGKRISISGLRGEDNAYLLDGSYINDFKHHIPAGPAGALLGVETVREFQVLTNSYSARYGRVIGGVFNAVSKSGTNEWHGDAYEFLRNSALDARNFFDQKAFPTDPRLPPFRRNQFGATFGGPIRKDRTFFFLNYESARESLSNTTFANVPDANARLGILPTGRVPVSPKIAPYLPYFPLPSPQGKNFGDGTAQYVFQFSQPTVEEFGLGRLDHQFSEGDSLFGRFTGSNSNRVVVQGYPAYGDIQYLNSRLITVSETHIFSPQVLNTVRVSFNRIDPGDIGTYPPAVPALASVPGQVLPLLSPGNSITALGGLTTAVGRNVTNRFNYQDDVTWTRGNHSLQFGGTAERMQYNQILPDRPFGEWDFGSLANFLQAIPSAYRGTPPQIGNATTGNRQWFFGLYIQDDWRVRPSLTVNLGLRWDPYTVATEVNGRISNLRHLYDGRTTVGDPYWLNKSMKDFGPRFGFAWSPFASGKTSVRGGFGLSYSPVDPETYQTRLARIDPLYPLLNFPNPTHFPDALAEIAARTVTSFGSIQPLDYSNLKTPRAFQYNFNIQQQVGANNMFMVGYTGSRALHTIAFGDYNSPLATYDGTSLAIPANATVNNPAFSCICLTTTSNKSWYNGLITSFQRKFSAGLQAQLSYTFSKGMSLTDNDQTTNAVGGGGNGSPKYPWDMKINKAVSAYDIRNKLSVNYSYDLPWGKGMKGIAGHLLPGWQWTGILTVQNGMPVWVTGAVPSTLSALEVANRSPNLLPGFTSQQITKGGPDLYFNPLAYSVPGARELGNLGRNTLVGPGLATLDTGLTKITPLTERWRLQFRAEVFNLLNRANFADPASSVFTATGGRVGSAGSVTKTVTNSRQVQFSLKLSF